MNVDSTYKVPYTTILAITPHNNAEKLEIATVYGFQVIIPKNVYKVGSKIVYIPIDSILPSNVEALIFGSDSKIKLTKSRVRQIRIRGLASQGMIVNPKNLESLVKLDGVNLETDLSAILGITKYEPEEKGPSQTLGKPGSRKQLAHPDFHSYNGLGNIKWFPDLFKDGEQVVVQEKLHGTNARAAKLPFRANTLLKKIKKFFGFAPAYENLYGSNRVDITNSNGYSGFYGDDVYGNVFKKLDVFSKIKPNEIVFGEIVGPGIQKGYAYGLKEHKFILFDVKRVNPDGTQEWLDPVAVQQFAIQRDFSFVPVLYEGPYNKEFIQTLSTGASVFDPNEKVREGAVLKAIEGYSQGGNKKALKMINEDYLADTKNTDNH